MSHTPGPWKADVDRGEINSVKLNVCSPYCDGTGIGWNKDDDLLLAAAAPDLLEALKSIIDIGKRDLSNPKYDGYFDEAIAAIAKAEGKS